MCAQTLTVSIPLAIVSMALFSTTTALSVLDTADAFVNAFGIMAVALVAVIIVAWLLHKLPVLVEHLNRRSSFRVGLLWKLLVGVLAPVVLGYLFVSELISKISEPYSGYPRLVPRDLRLGHGRRPRGARAAALGTAVERTFARQRRSRVRRVPLRRGIRTRCGDIGHPDRKRVGEGGTRMTTTAIVMMIIAMVTVWGGLIAAIVNLAGTPRPAENEPAPPVEL